MRWWFWALLLGCSGTGPRPVLENRASVTARPQCTEELVNRFATMLRDRWRVDRLELRCAAGSFGVAGYFLEASNAQLRRVGVVDASGAELVAFVDEPELERGTFLNGYVAADLDGDGHDEIIESWRRVSPDSAGPDHWLVIRRIGDGELIARIQGPYLSRFHPDLDGGCSGTWQLRDTRLGSQAIIVAVERFPGLPPSDCLPEGRHVFALRGSSLESTP
jgi:hypothetical protein